MAGQRERREERQSACVHAHGHTVVRARSKIRTSRFLTPRHIAKPQTHADSWQSFFHIPLTQIHPSLSLGIL